MSVFASTRSEYKVLLSYYTIQYIDEVPNQHTMLYVSLPFYYGHIVTMLLYGTHDTSQKLPKQLI